jgi:hypothetical protein
LRRSVISEEERRWYEAGFPPVFIVLAILALAYVMRK